MSKFQKTVIVMLLAILKSTRCGDYSSEVYGAERLGKLFLEEEDSIGGH